MSNFVNRVAVTIHPLQIELGCRKWIDASKINVRRLVGVPFMGLGLGCFGSLIKQVIFVFREFETVARITWRILELCFCLCVCGLWFVVEDCDATQRLSRMAQSCHTNTAENHDKRQKQQELKKFPQGKRGKFGQGVDRCAAIAFVEQEAVRKTACGPWLRDRKSVV